MENNNISIETDRPTSGQLKEELSRIGNVKRTIMFFLLIFFSSICALFIISVSLFSINNINYSSMSPTIKEGDTVISFRYPKISECDIITYKYGNGANTGRIIGKAGDVIDIDRSGTVTVNGIEIIEDYISEKLRGDCTLTFPCTVPDGEYFVLGDNRKTDDDSRNVQIGCIKKSQIIGQVILH